MKNEETPIVSTSQVAAAPATTKVQNVMAKGKELATSLLTGKNAKYVKIAGIVIIAIIALLLLKALIGGGSNIPEYSLLFTNEDGDLMLVNANSKEAEKVASVDEDELEVEYANTNKNDVLYSKDGSLYILNTKKADKSTKIDNDVEVFDFNVDDEYVVYINDESDLYGYDMKKTYKIASNVDYIIGTTDKKIVFIKKGDLYVASLKAGKDDAEKVASDVYTAIITEDAKYIVYLDEDYDLYKGKLSNFKGEKILSDCGSVIDANDDFSKFLYMDDDELILFKNGKTTKLADDVDKLFAADLETLQFIYGTETDSGDEDDDDDYYNYDYDYDYDYDYSTASYDLYYQLKDKEATKIAKDAMIDDAIIHNEKEIYFVETEDDEAVLKYAKISGSKVKDSATKVDDAAYISMYDYLKDGLLYLKANEDYEYELKVASKGKGEEVADNVSSYSIEMTENKKDVYFISDYEDGEGKLSVYNGSKVKEISSDVSDFVFINRNLIYIFKDGDAELYIYNGSKERKVADDIVDFQRPYFSYED